jgi:hypothetical protein
MHQRDPNRLFDGNTIFIGVLIAALLVAGLFVFWPRGTTTTGTAMRDDSPRVERPAQKPTPAPAPTKPAQ